MKKLFLSLGLIASFAGYAMFLNFQKSRPAIVSSNVPATTGGTQRGGGANRPAVSSPAVTKPAPAKQSSGQSSGMMGMGGGMPMRGMYRDGTYTGSPADAYYGIVQVKAIIRNGKITDVQFLSYPNDRSTSAYISSIATPLLASEAIQSQSANVDIVSGASETSGAFMRSLASALSQAK